MADTLAQYATVAAISEITDPPKSAGLVVTQVKSIGSHAMHHPVFKSTLTANAYATFTPSAPADGEHTVGKDGSLTVAGATSVVFSRAFPDATATAALRDQVARANLREGFCGVCISNTELVSSDETASFNRSAKRRKREDPRISVAVAGTVTMPFWIPSAYRDGEEPIVPGDFVSFIGDGLLRANSDNVRVLDGTQGRKVPEYTVRIRKFHEPSTRRGARRTCTAPFGVCVSVNPDEGQITVLLRMDLYHTYLYP